MCSCTGFVISYMARIIGISTPCGINYATNMRSLSSKGILGKASFLKGNDWVVVEYLLTKPEDKLEQQQNKDGRPLPGRGANLVVHLFFVERICAG